MSTFLSPGMEQYLYDRIQQMPTGSFTDQLLFTVIRGLSSLRPLHSKMRHVGGRIHYIRGDYAAAEHWLLKSLATGRKGKASTHNFLGRAQTFLGKFSDAEKNLQTAISAVPYNDGYFLHMADTLRRQGKHEQAEPYLRKALDIRPNSAWNHFCLFQNIRARLGTELALDAWLDGVLAVPTMEAPIIYPDWWLVHRNAYSPEREEKARTILARHPNAKDCNLLLAYLLRYSDEPSESTPYLQAASRNEWEASQGTGAGADFAAAKPPAFLVMGVAKSGSSSLYQYLCMHPLICKALAKEINFWTDHYEAGGDWYQAFFPPIPPEAPQISGEASIKTFWLPEAPKRIATDFPNMKLILILREPAARAFSDYNMIVRMGREHRPWEECVDQELAELPHCPLDENEIPAGAIKETGYLARGAALPMLKQWLRHHDKDKILVLQNRDLGEHTTATMSRVFRFLGLPEHDIVAPPRMNVGGYKASSDELNQRLQEWYRPHQEALQEFLAREFP
jgi:tetratricopeptide (TPR) repeat protein